MLVIVIMFCFVISAALIATVALYLVDAATGLCIILNTFHAEIVLISFRHVLEYFA